MRLNAALDRLHTLTPIIHSAAHLGDPDASLFDRSYGNCDLMTKLAVEQLTALAYDVLIFVGINIPRQSIRSKTTHTSHTLGVCYNFRHHEDADLAIFFDYACAQYGHDMPLLAKVVPKELLYKELRDTYGGGIWQPGGSWLAQIDTSLFMAPSILESTKPRVVDTITA